VLNVRTVVEEITTVKSQNQHRIEPKLKTKDITRTKPKFLYLQRTWTEQNLYIW